MKVAIGILWLMLGGCADDASDTTRDAESAEARAERKCAEFIGGVCDSYVRCGVVSPGSGMPFTASACDAARPALVRQCVKQSSDEIAMTSDAEFDACTRALRDEACELLCDRVPEDPPACLALDGYAPQTLATTCEP
ncbi:MAG TPA: hypothetical protein VMS65_06730 [Polyangiaceae bacterium]|nr:hypothetical protein [Polyangiaceae bacterium]